MLGGHEHEESNQYRQSSCSNWTIFTGDRNGMVYTSGVIPVVPSTGEIPEGAAAQADQAIGNLAALLKEAGTSTENVVKTTVFIKNMEDFGTINEVYAKYFTGTYPARSCVEVARLPKDVLIEIEAIAIK